MQLRESIGATFLIKIMVVFIVIYNSLLAVAVNYAMVFRVKNRIIDLIEQHEGCKGAKQPIQDYIANVGYYRAASSVVNPYDIIPVKVPGRGTYYKVNTYIVFNFPILQNVFYFNVSGDTQIVYGVNEDEWVCNWPR